MTANRTLMNPQDYTHIRTIERHQIRYWTGRLSVSESELVELVGRHGTAVATILRVLSTRDLTLDRIASTQDANQGARSASA